MAGGTEILQAMEIRVAAESAVFGVAEVRRGLFPLGGSTVRLRRQIPYTIAAELLLTGARCPPPEAKEVGLIGHVVPDGQALAKARELADQIAANGPLAVQAVLRSLRESANLSEAEALANELELGLARLRQQRRQGGPHGLRREARPRLHRHLTDNVLCTETLAMRTQSCTDVGSMARMAIARWKDLCIDATDAHRMARFWGELLGLEVELHDDGDAALRGATPEQTIWVNAVPEPRTVKQRVHLDIETPSLEPVLALGATVVAPGRASPGSGWDVPRRPRGRRAVRLRARRRADPALYEMGVDTADAASARAAWRAGGPT